MASWSLTVTLKGAKKTFDDLDPSITVDAFATQVSKAFKKKNLTLRGGFPPQPLDGALALSAATRDGTSLLAVEAPKAPKAPKAEAAPAKAKALSLIHI